MESMTPDFSALYMEFLNGGAPVDESAEIKEWAENICRARGSEINE